MDSLGAIVFLPREEGLPSLMLEPILFDSAALWLSAALERAGVRRFLVVCDREDLAAAQACFPQDTQFVTDTAADAPAQLSAFLRQVEGPVALFTRPVFLDDRGARRLFGQTGEELPQGEDAGTWLVTASHLSAALEEGEDFLSAVQRTGRAFGVRPGLFEGLCPLEAAGPAWDDVQELAKAASVARLQAQFPTRPVRFVDRQSVYIGPRVTVGAGSRILPGTILRGETSIGRCCEIGPNAMLTDCHIGDRVSVNASQLISSTVEEDTTVGPFAYVRPGTHVGKGVKVGDFVELKNSTIGDGTKISHLTYVGDSDVGEEVNFGCGTVTVNYDGEKKFRTTIGHHAFIGCNTNLVAPVRIGDGAYTAAGSTITEDVPDDSLAIARDRQVVKKNWAARRRGKK